MKKNKLFSCVSKISLPLLLLMLVTALFAMFLIVSNGDLVAMGFPSGFKGLFATLFDFTKYVGTPHFIGQVIGSVLAILVAAIGLCLCVASLVVIRLDKKLKWRAACLSILLLVPASIGLLGGSVNFFAEGLVKVLSIGDLRSAVLAALLVVLYVLDLLFIIAVICFAVCAIKHNAKVNKGALPVDKEAEHQEALKGNEDLLLEIKLIVRQELDRLDRVTILTEKEVVREAEKPVEPIQEPAPAPAPLVEEVKPEPIPEPVPAPAPVEEEEEEEEEVPGKKINAQRIPFAKKILKAEKDLQNKYNELKSDLLAYGASSRLSVGGDTFRLHRKPYVKITMVGKSLKVYFALDPEQFKDSPIPVIDAGDKNTYVEVPSCLRVKSDLSVRRAKALAAQAFAADGYEKKGEPEEHNHVRDIRAAQKAAK